MVPDTTAQPPLEDPLSPREDRRQLQAVLREQAPWLTSTEAGPAAVQAGQCDRCGQRPRLLPTCGPVAWPAICRACAQQVGTDAWCDGHADDAEELLAWARDLPAWWGDAVVLWWVSTGEVASGPVHPHPELPAPIASAAP